MTGTYESFTDTLFYAKTLSFNPYLKKNSSKALNFSTIWPVIEELLTSESVSIDSKTGNIDDQSIETIKDLAYHILSKASIGYSLPGPRLIHLPLIHKPVEEYFDYKPNPPNK